MFCGDTKQWLMAAKGLSYLWLCVSEYLWLCGEMLVVIGYCSLMLSCTWAVGAQPCAWKDNCYYTNCEVSFSPSHPFSPASGGLASLVTYHKPGWGAAGSVTGGVTFGNSKGPARRGAPLG